MESFSYCCICERGRRLGGQLVALRGQHCKGRAAEPGVILKRKKGKERQLGQLAKQVQRSDERQITEWGGPRPRGRARRKTINSFIHFALQPRSPSPLFAGARLPDQSHHLGGQQTALVIRSKGKSRPFRSYFLNVDSDCSNAFCFNASRRRKSKPPKTDKNHTP